MRRRRLIGMYRVLLKSMSLVRSGCKKGKIHDGAAVKARDLRNRTRTGPGIEPIRLVPPAQSIRPLKAPVLPVISYGFPARFLNNSPYDLGMRGPSCNELVGAEISAWREPRHDHIRQT